MCPRNLSPRFTTNQPIGQGLRLAFGNRLLKTAPQHDERGKWIFQLKSRIISAQGIILCSKRLIKWDAIDTELRCSWISAGHVHWKLLALKKKNGYMAFTYGKDIFTHAFCLLVLSVLAESSSIEMINDDVYETCKTPASSNSLYIKQLLNQYVVLEFS